MACMFVSGKRSNEIMVVPSILLRKGLTHIQEDESGLRGCASGGILSIYSTRLVEKVRKSHMLVVADEAVHSDRDMDSGEFDAGVA